MCALTAEPGSADSLQIDELPDPRLSDGEMVVAAVAVGVCGTDKEI